MGKYGQTNTYVRQGQITTKQREDKERNASASEEYTALPAKGGKRKETLEEAEKQ